ncbi:MAG: aspartate-semialdehyde dehydrogenase [Candidatus Hydrogenedentota bacterium]
MDKLRVGVIGATGMVGQRFVTLLENHPWFDTVLVAASASSAGKTYEDAVAGRWTINKPIPSLIAKLIVYNAQEIADIAQKVDFVFCAVDMSKDEILKLEENYAKAEVPVVSNNSAHRGTMDVPMMIPEINSSHTAIINKQKERLGTKRGFIAVKPNCSLQSYTPAIHPLIDFEPTDIIVATYQAISGAGKTFETWAEMIDNVIPFIKGEEEKSEQEPMKIWGRIEGDRIINATSPKISAQCIRVPVTDGHLAAVSVKFKKKPKKEDIISRWKSFEGEPQKLNLPLAPKPFLTYFEEDIRPQTKLDRDISNGMGIAIGRLREDKIFDYRFVCLSHNTIRGAAGGAILIAELLFKQGYLGRR